MTIAVAGLLSKILMMTGSHFNKAKLTKKSRVKDKVIEPGKIGLN